MTHSRHSSPRAFLLVAIVAAGVGLHSRAAVDSGAQYWTIEDGTIPHIVYNTNRGINFAIDKYGASGWEVVVHHAQGGCRIASIPEMAWQLGLRQYDRLDAEGVNDWNYHPDVSGYTERETLGEFTHTISEEDFATNRFFRLELVDW